MVTLAYSLALLVYALIEHDAVLKLRPNEFAEFLGGVFAPLAFLWLVLGFLQQGEELRNSADALRLQEEELHNLVEQQAQLVAATREQSEFQRNRADAAEKEAHRLAQPTLVLKGGTSRTSAESPGKLVRTFHLQNVGTTCTLVKVDLGGLGQPIRYASLTNGTERSFDVTFDLASFEGATLTVEYMDGRGEPGQKKFHLRKRGAHVSVVHKSD